MQKEKKSTLANQVRRPELEKLKEAHKAFIIATNLPDF